MNIHLTRRKPNETKVTEVRSLTVADLALLRVTHGPADPVKVLRERHHRLAFLVALGKTNNDIAAECHCSTARVAQHKRSPAFAELVSRYQAEIESSRLEYLREFGAKAAHNMSIAEAVVERGLTRILADPEPNLADLRFANRAAVDRMDRFGYGKHTTSDNRNVNINFAANLEAAIARARKVA